MNSYLKSRIERHGAIEQCLHPLLLAWLSSRRLLAILIQLHECIARLPEATLPQQAVWRHFCATHSVRQVAEILALLEQRGLTVADFVEAWLNHSDLPLAIHALWRTPNAGR
jgi:hypothetical protein